MRETRKSGSMSGDRKRNHGWNEAPPAYAKAGRQQLLPSPTVTAPVLDSTRQSAASARPRRRNRFVEKHH